MKLVKQLKAGRYVQKLKGSRNLSESDVHSLKESLLSMGAPAIGPLMDSLSHGDARGPAMDVLGQLLTNETLPNYLEALSSSNPAIVSGVTKVLSQSKGYDPTDLLALVSDPTIPKASVETILAERVEALRPRRLISMVPELGKEGRATIFRLLDQVADESIVPDVIKLIDHEDWWVRLYSVKLLGKFPDDEGTNGVIRLLKDKNKSVRLEAVASLHKLKAKAAVPNLCATLRDPDLKVQSAAIDALVDVADASDVPHLLEVLKDESEHARRASVEVLNEVATTKAIQDLVRALRDEDWWVRVRAADALGTLGGPKVVDAILGLLKDDDDFIRRYAVEILNAIPSERAVEPLIKSLGDGDWWVRERSIDALAKTGDPRAVEPLIDLLKENPAAGPLCARALGEIKDPRAVNPLCEALKTDNEELRREAGEALIAISKDLPREERDRISSILAKAHLHPEARAAVPFKVGRKHALFGPEDARRDPHASEDRPAHGHAGRGSTSEVSGGGSGTGEPASPEGALVSPIKKGDRPINFHRLKRDTVLLDRYRVIKQIGKGGFGAIYLVEDSAIEEDLILKILNPQLSMDDSAIRRFVQELKITRKITHKNVIRIYDFLDLGGAHAVSMEYFPSQDLGKLVRTGGRIPPKRGLKIVAQICEGLIVAHSENVIHRDIKPANVLLGERDEVKIVDFGLASAGQQMGSRLTKSGLLIGTPEYMAPEQISGDEVDARADIYALGILMYELFSGEKPFTAETPVKVLFLHLEGEVKPLGTLVEDISLDLEYLVSCTMARNPDDRPDTAEALLEMVERTLAELEAAA